MQLLITQKYILRNVANKRKSREYAQKILRFAKDTRIINMHNQLNLIYNDIDIDVRVDNLCRFKQDNIINNLFINFDKFKLD